MSRKKQKPEMKPSDKLTHETELKVGDIVWLTVEDGTMFRRVKIVQITIHGSSGTFYRLLTSAPGMPDVHVIRQRYKIMTNEEFRLFIKEQE